MPRTRTPGWAVLLMCLAAPVHAQYTQQGSKLAVSGAVGSPAAGTSVALSADGNTAIVGGSHDNSGAGAVWVYTRSNGSWVQQGGKLVSSDTVGVAQQGSSVALSADGNTAAVGGLSDNDGTGAMWVYTRINGVWTPQGNGTRVRQWGTVLHGIAHQGVSIALSADGNTALLGGELDNADTNQLGAAWVFTRTNGVWGLVPQAKLVGNGVGQAHQGASVALSADGNTAILGGPGDSDGTGAAFVFTRVNGAWTQQGNKLIGFGATAGANLGSSVALSADGNTAVVGGSGDNNAAGAVWVFTRANGQWTQQGNKLVGTDPASSRYLGQSIALTGDGNTAIAGGPGGLPKIGSSPAVGAIWVFTRSNGVWSQQGSEFSGFGTVGNDALQGSAVAVAADGTTALVGGPTDNGDSGAVWTFTRPVAPSPPAINSQPASGTVPSGQAATLTVVATGAAPLSYQWYQGTSGNTSTPVGTNTPTFATPVLIGTTSYWVRVSNPYGTADSSTATLTLGPPPASGPAITHVVSVASQSPTIAPNTFVEIHGTNLAPDTRSWQGSDFANNQLPVQLDTVTVTVNGRSAYVEYISPTQVNILTPPDLLQGTVQILMSSGGVNSAPFSVPAQPIAPAFFVFPGGPYVAAEHTNGAYLAPPSLVPGATPAKPGETVVLYGSGFGPTTPPVVSGSLVQSGVLPTPPVFIIGGIAATVQFAGLIVPGEFQFNVVVPPNVPDGDNTITAVYNGLSTQTGLLLTVQR